MLKLRRSERATPQPGKFEDTCLVVVQQRQRLAGSACRRLSVCRYHIFKSSGLEKAVFHERAVEASP